MLHFKLQMGVSNHYSPSGAMGLVTPEVLGA